MSKERDEGEISPRPDGRAGVQTRNDRDLARQVCAKRLDNGGWCVLPDGHDQDPEPTRCTGYAPMYRPWRPPIDRHLLAEFRKELSEKYDDAKRDYEWKDRFGKVVPKGFSPAQWWSARATGAAR